MSHPHPDLLPSSHRGGRNRSARLRFLEVLVTTNMTYREKDTRRPEWGSDPVLATALEWESVLRVSEGAAGDGIRRAV